MMTATSTTITPEVLWAQRTDEVFLTINVADLAQPKIDLTATGLTFSGTAQGKEYKLDLEFFKEVDVEKSKQNITLRNITLVIAKKTTGEEYWPRLTKEKGRYHWLKTNFDLWKDEDDEDDEAKQPGMDGLDFSQFQGMGGMGGMGGMPGMEGLAGAMGGMGGMGGMEGMNFDGAEAEGDSDDDEELPPLEATEK
ncbi:hypothetical protein HDU87_000331 [Geranomyces variabilis]|uniref:CS domain-containing protein n=1 Tax=Geranomyces variabilis TaxID=109894 RepID=A0AAD5TQM7_9FUNG|nr:hypothetical protein HDU87_000331 [Geranomyces variabilis]